MSVDRLSERSGGVIGTIGPIGGSGVFSLQERYALSVDNYDDVSLYLKMNGANGSTTFYDSSLYGHAVTANGNAQISTAQSKFGGASAAFDGSGDYLSVPDDASLRLGSGDFTVESWIYITSYSVGYGSPINSWAAAICAKDGFTNRSYSWTITGTASSYTAISFTLFENDSTQTSTTASHTFSLNTWYHVAAVRFGTSLRLYVNGVDVGGGANSVNAADTTTPLFVGTINYDGGTPTTRYQYWFPGYIDDLRITKGVARYTANFTPPQREFRP